MFPLCFDAQLNGWAFLYYIYIKIMRYFSTYIKAIDPNTKELCTYEYSPIQAPCKQWAREYCDANGLGFLFIGDEVISIIPCNEHFEPDFSKKIDLDYRNN